MYTSSSHRTVDTNGFYEIVDNPISKTGVFDYLGSSIKSYYLPDGEKRPISPEDFGHLFKVFRSEDELSSQNTIDSFKLLPWFDEHEMVGKKGIPAEEKGIEGVIGEKVYFKDDTLFANLKILSEDLKIKINQGKKQLSIGYEDKKVYDPGVYKGQAYDFISKNLVGNHIALVDVGRCGADVSVMDSADETGRNQMSKLEKEAVLDRVSTAEDQLSTVMDKMEKMEKSYSKDKEEKYYEEDKKDMHDKHDTYDKDKDKDKSEDKHEDKSEDGDLETAAAKIVKCMKMEREGKISKSEMNKKIREIVGDQGEDKEKSEDEKEDKTEDNKERGYAMDSNEIASMQTKLNILIAKEEKQNEIESYRKKMALFDDLSSHVGTFDHADMNLNQMAKYGVKKLGLECEEGVEVPVLRTYLNTMPKNVDYSAWYTFDHSDNQTSIKSLVEGNL